MQLVSYSTYRSTINLTYDWACRVSNNNVILRYYSKVISSVTVNCEAVSNIYVGCFFYSPLHNYVMDCHNV